VIVELSPTLIPRRLISLFPADLIEGIARDAVTASPEIDITMLIWSFILGFVVDGETRSIAAFQRAYQTATNQTVFRSSFYDRFTPELGDLLSDLLAHASEEVAVPHTIALQLTQLCDTMITTAT
jgi:putative transposase